LFLLPGKQGKEFPIHYTDHARKGNLNSGIVDTVLYSRDVNPRKNFISLIVDTLQQRIWWTDSGHEEPDGTAHLTTLMHSSMDGSNPEVFVLSPTCGAFPSPADIELDIKHKMLYLGSQTDEVLDCGLTRFDMESGHKTDLETNGIYHVISIQLDLENRMFYRVNEDWQSRKPDGILRAPLDDIASDEYVLARSGIRSIALAQKLSKIYWSNADDNTIRRANVDGTEVEQVVASQINNWPTRLAIDNQGQKLYWTEYEAGNIMRANLDGSNVETVLQTTNPGHIALAFGGQTHTAVEAVKKPVHPVTLQSMYPHPVEDRAILTIALTTPTYVLLEVYDSLGRRVETLASRRYPAGTSRVEWHPTEQVNGVYFVRMVSDKRSETLPIVLKR